MDHGAGLLLFNNMSMKEYSASHSDANDSLNCVSTPDSAVFATEATPTADLGYRGRGLDLGAAGGCPLGLILQIWAELHSSPPAPLLETVFHSSTRIKVSECRDPWGSGLPGSRCPSVRERASAGPSETQGDPTAIAHTERQSGFLYHHPSDAWTPKYGPGHGALTFPLQVKTNRGFST